MADLRDQPAYPLAEAARYLKVPIATLRTWVLGRPYRSPEGTGRAESLISPASEHPPLLSFSNLIEAHVLQSLRTDHDVSLKSVRSALTHAESTLGIQRLLLSKQLLTDAGRVFLDCYSKLIELSASRQLAMRQLFEDRLRRVEWDESLFPVRLYPALPIEPASGAKPIAIDPRIAFGRPVMVRAGISTAAIAARIDAGESPGELAADYGLTEAEVRQAVVFERAA